jgi:hypothetical protein
MRTAQVRLSTVTLDMADALELSELLDYLAQWLGVAGEPVRVDLENFAWDEGAMPMVGERLASFARLLVFGHAPSENDDDLDNDANQDQPW